MIGARRRWLMVVVALAIASVLLRTQVAVALVYRGDDALARADATRAAGYYRRALLLDGGSSLAADRLSFAAFLQNEPIAMRWSLGVLDRAIAQDPRDMELRRDRALLELHLKHPEAAARDLAFVGGRADDPRALAFAGILERRAGHCREAFDLLGRSIALEPGLQVAKRQMGMRC